MEFSGVVKLTSKSSDRGREIVGLLFPPDFFGHAFAPFALNLHLLDHFKLRDDERAVLQ